MGLPTRRDILKIGAAMAGSAAAPTTAHAEDTAPSRDDAKAILYDATRCIGCRSCARRCREVNNLAPTPIEHDGVEFDAPRELSPNDWMVLELHGDNTHASTKKQTWSFLKRNCMHCNTPACASACPVAALRKTDGGPVVYDEDRCIGCRYCLLACPYEVPRYEWLDRMPRVRKCNLNGACVAACPTHALVGGTRKQLIEEAHTRIGKYPQRYHDHVYGEFEGGGASYLILSALPFEQLNLPALPPTARSSEADALMSAVPGWIIGLGLFLGGLHQLDKRQQDLARHDANASGDAAQIAWEGER